MIRQISNVASRVVRSEKFFWVVLVWFIISATWVATASLYPMAFDEEVHFGLIKLFAEQLSPYGIEPKGEMAYLGLGPAEVSYAFHYLMSFPYRLLDTFGISEQAIIIVLRLVNIAMVVGAIVLYRKALFAAKVPRGVVHGSLAAFTLIPIMPLMAGQLNYDNLLLLLVALAFYLIISITDRVYSDKQLPVAQSLWFFAVVLASVPVKYAYLPIGLGFGLWYAWLVYFVMRKSKKNFYKNISSQFSHVKKLTLAAVAVVMILGVFFSYRYVDNSLQYGSAIPSCDDVFSRTDCFDYGPWARTQRYLAAVDPNFEPFPFPVYMAVYWVPDMIQRLTFSVAGPTNTYETKLPLPVLRTVGVIFLFMGVVAFAMRAKELFRKWPYMALTVLVSLIYMGTLAIKLYSGYSNTSIPAAINGRYLLPLIPLLFALLTQAIMLVATEYKRRKEVTALLAIMLVLVFIQGGGVFTYFVVAESYWFWDGWGQSSHEILQNVLRPITWH